MNDVLAIPAQLAAAFCRAQKAFLGAAKDSTNPHFKSKYADLESVMAAIKPALAENGLSFIQRMIDNPTAASVETIIIHESGEAMSCGVLAVPVSKADAQGFGSAMTYARRYSLAAAFGIAPEDDDGNGATKSWTPADGPRSPVLPAPAQTQAAKPTQSIDDDGEVVSPENATIIRKKMMDSGKTEVALLAFLKTKAKSLDLITPAEAQRAANALSITLIVPAAAAAKAVPASAPAKTAADF